MQKAPLLQIVYSEDVANHCWVAMLLHHHLVVDHLALEVIQQELSWHLLGHEDIALQVAVPYRNYVAQARLGVSAAAHEAFFREMLGDVDQPTLPYGRQDVQGNGSGVSEARLLLDASLSLRLRQQARQLGVSAASLHHLAWARVLGQLSGREDVVFGTVLLGRMQGSEGVERALGMYINTLPLRLNVGSGSVRAGVQETHVRLTGLLAHEHASLALAQRASRVAAELPLFSALLNYRHSAPEVSSERVQRAWDGIDALGGEERSNYPLALSVDDLGAGFCLTLQAVSGVNAERVCGYMQSTLLGLVECLEQGGTQPINQLEILPAAELSQLAAWNATTVDYPQDQCIHQLFETQVERTPDATAVVFEGQHLSYGELNQRANQVAHRLLALGVQPDDRVAICVERSLEMVVGLLGILKAGASYVPLDPAYPAERLAYMLADSQPVALLIQAALQSTLVVQVPVLQLDQEAAFAAFPTYNPQVAGLTSSHLAYVIYTSGSTGQPKGVMVEHQTVANLLGNTAPWFLFGSRDVCALLHSFSFDSSVRVIWGTLLHGGQLLVVPHLTILSMPACYELICEAGVTVLNQTPSAFRQLMVAQGESRRTHCLRQMIFGGEAVEPALFQSWYARAENAATQLVNEYGPTEATVFSTFYEMSLADQDAAYVPIGRPIGNTQIYILDRQQQPLPIGVAGEIYIGGAGVTRGYLNRPELTAERFVPDPFSAEPGARMYRTGDVGRYQEDGNLVHLGRSDDQVKLRGFRIELGEIEANLMAHPAVQDAVVLVRADDAGDRRLVAYYTLRQPETEVDAAALRRHVQASLPEYMVPAAYVQMLEWPLTPNKKLDRKALPAPDDSAFASRAYKAPQGEVEQQLAAIWQELLGVERVGRNDNFFELGGHSLLAVRLSSLVRKHMRVELIISSLFAKPILCELAQVLQRTEPSVRPKIMALPRAR